MKLKDRLGRLAPNRSDCFRVLFCGLPIAVIALCIVAVLAVGLSMVLPYAYVDHFSEQSTNCTPRAVEYHPNVDCNCWEATHISCRTRYPCVEVLVDYIDTYSGELVENATLYSQPYDYTTLKLDGCSVLACKRDPDVNNQTTMDFIQQYGTPTQTFACHHGVSSDPEVLLSIIERWKILLGMLIPASLIMTAVVVLFCYCVVRTWFKKKMPVSKMDYPLQTYRL